MITKYIKNIYMFIINIKNKLNLPDLIQRIFTKNNVSKILIIFTVGLITRIIISNSYNVNVFIEFFNKISIIYYSLMSIFVVVLNEVFTYFELNILPQFIFEFFTLLRGLTFNIIKSTSQLTLKILNLKFSDFSLKSIAFSIKNLVNYCINDRNKLTIGESEPESNIESNKLDKPIKISYVLNKDEDNIKLPNKVYKPSQSSQPLTQNTSNDAGPSKSKSKSTINSLGKSDKTIPFVFIGDESEFNNNNRRLSTSNKDVNIREQYPSSSVYSEESLRQQSEGNNRGLQDFSLYDDVSNFNTPSTMTPLFNNSQINIERNSVLNISNNSLRPASLNIQNRTEINQNSETSSGVISPYIQYPYGLSGNGVLPNITFQSVSPVIGNIPLNNGITSNRNLPLLPANYENNLNNVADTPRVDDPCSFQYQSRHRESYLRRRPSSLQYELGLHRPQLRNQALLNEQSYHYNPNITQEIEITKSGIRGKVKLVFKQIGSKFTNGVNKIESAYVKYETVSKRHVVWYLIEESGGRYESYDDFKKEWDSKKSIWKEIKERTKKDIKSVVEGALGLSNNKPAIEGNMNREIEDLLRTKHPFDNSNRPGVNNITNNSDTINPKENSSNNKFDEGNKGKGKHVHKNRHKHSHRNHSNRYKKS